MKLKLKLKQMLKPVRPLARLTGILFAVYAAYNVYIIIDKEDEQWWKKKSHSPIDVFVPSGKKVSVVQLKDEQQLYEYDPPYMQIWCLPGCFDGDRHLYYVDWKNTNYCR